MNNNKKERKELLYEMMFYKKKLFSISSLEEQNKDCKKHSSQFEIA